MKRKQKSAQPGRSNKVKRNGVVYVEYGKLKSFIVELGLSDFEFAVRVPINIRTLERIRSGTGIRPSNLRVVVDFLNGLRGQGLPKNLAPITARDLLSPEQPWGTMSECGESSTTNPAWEIMEEPAGWSQVANGLEFKVCRLKHSQLPDTFGRGKLYRLDNLATGDEARARAYLLRHPEVSRQFRHYPQIAINLEVFPLEEGKTWWVIDEWIGGQSLEDALKVGPLARADLPRVMRQIADALLILHRAVMIRRELSPWNIWLREGNVVLTDLEMCKLFNGYPTVSSVWQKNPYRAPEVETALQVDARVDVYSWGRIFVHAACGQLPARGMEQTALASAPIPTPVRAIVLRCVSRLDSERPRSVDEVLKALDGWQ